jgi:hypothetical protein
MYKIMVLVLIVLYHKVVMPLVLVFTPAAKVELFF